ncbi:MAG: glycosyltransferase [Acidobacteriota bacterium]|nr:glycosyltransferase [Acidobacteriota bacterium]
MVNAESPTGFLTGPKQRILVVDDDEQLRSFYMLTLKASGWDVLSAKDGADALSVLEREHADLVVSDVMMPNLDGLGFLLRIREDPVLRAIPVLLLTTRGALQNVVEGLHLGADDYLVKPIQGEELVARVRARLLRPPVPADMIPKDVRTGLLKERAFLEETGREMARARRGSPPGCVAVLDIFELARLRESFGTGGELALARQLGGIIAAAASPLDMLGRDAHGRFLFLLPETGVDAARRRLHGLARLICSRTFDMGGNQVRPTPVVGIAGFGDEVDAQKVLRRAHVARERALLDLNLQPVAWQPEMGETAQSAATDRDGKGPAAGANAFPAGLRLGIQVAATYVLAIAVPFLLYLALGPAGRAVSRIVYLLVVAALVFTCLLIWAEGFRALARRDPPDEPARPYPTASAIIAAYLPNEAATVESTIAAFLRLDYPAELEIILAYNTPRDHPIEEVLREIARKDPRFRPFRVNGSESKAQNVNAALSEIRGEFVGIFDADHHPDPDSFTRAWRWLSHGNDIVQGHCLARNGDATWVSRIVAVEFEQIYAVSHPGRARLHGFGIFGGSNGYWRTSLLRETRMHGFMLTEDIDSSLRVIAAGGKIVSDPRLVSRELAPTTLGALWNQRLRWAQGWFQVSLEHFRTAIRSPRLTLRNKVGLFYLLVWREIFPWIAVQIAPIVLYWAVALGGVRRLEWWIPLFVVTTLFTLGTGPGQALFTYRLADPQVKRHTSWFWSYVLSSVVFYTGFKNLVARVAQVKEVMKERDWRVTPRA